jgi:hypothetical protein
MVWIYLLVGGASLIGLLLLIATIRYKRKLKPVKEAFERLSIDKKMKVFKLISTHTEKPQTGAFLVPIGITDDPGLIIKIPEQLNSKWKGKAFSIAFRKEPEDPSIEIEIVDHQNDYSVLGGTKYIPVLAPRVITKNGKENNTWSARNLLGRNKELKKLIKSFIENKHVDLLTSIVANKPILANYYEPLDQIRIGDGLQWIQSREFVKCDICKRKMKYIFNLPGEYSEKKGYGEFVYYIFGCQNHPDSLKYVMQAF